MKRTKSAPKRVAQARHEPQKQAVAASNRSSVSSTRRKGKTIDTLWTRVVERGGS